MELAARVETLIESWSAIRLGLVAQASTLADQAEAARQLAGDRIVDELLVDREQMIALAEKLEAVAMQIASSLETIDRLTEQAQQTARMRRDDVAD